MLRNVITSQMSKGVFIAAILALVLVTVSLALTACSAARANPIAAGQAEFKVVALGVNPSQISPGENVVVNAKIVNSGDADGSYNAQLKVNGVVEAVGIVDIAAGSSREVTFNMSKDSVQSYTVSLGQMAGQFDVVAPQAASNTTLAGADTPVARPSCCQTSATASSGSSAAPVAGASCCGGGAQGAPTTPTTPTIQRRSCCGQ